MTPPRFRIRTLMIAVAIAGVGCWAAAASPEVFVGMTALCAGPLLAIVRESRGNSDDAYRYVISGSLGGVAGGLVLALFCAGLFAAWDINHYQGWDLIKFMVTNFFTVFFCMGVASGTIGAIVGMAVAVVSPRSPARPAVSPFVKVPGDAE